MGSVLPEEIHIFDSAASSVLDMEELGGYCRELLPTVHIENHGDFISYCMEVLKEGQETDVKDVIAAQIAAARVTDPARESGQVQPLPAVVQYERRMLDREPPRPSGVFYDGYELCRAYAELLSLTGRRVHGCLIIITNQLFGTYEDHDSRYHARVSIYGHPCLISTRGIVEAPARARSYYIKKEIGFEDEALEKGAAEAFLEHDDPRTTEVLKGYIAQSLFYYLIGEPFCEQKNCRLHNAHWQKDLLRAQLDMGRGLCGEHERILAEILKETRNG